MTIHWSFSGKPHKSVQRITINSDQKVDPGANSHREHEGTYPSNMLQPPVIKGRQADPKGLILEKRCCCKNNLENKEQQHSYEAPIY